MARRYRVLQPVAGLEPGQEFLLEDPSYNYAALLQGGFLEEITPKVACPACEADKAVKKDDVPHFQKAETLDDHYASEHPALATPNFEEIV